MTANASLLKLTVALATVGALGACDMGLQGRLDESRDARYAKAKAAVVAIEAARTQALASSVPAADAKSEGKLHPMHEWRKQVAEREADQTALIDLAKNAQPSEDGKREVGARGTPSEAAAELGASFVKESNAFWGDKSSVSRYVNFLESYLQNVEAERAKNPDMTVPPFIDEARFDLAFAHAASYYTINKNFDRAALLSLLNNTALVEDWEIAFGVPSVSDEGFSDYIMRLCAVAPTLKDKCEGYPHEFRALIIDREYVKWLRARAAAFDATTETTKIFDTILDQFVATLDETLKTELAVRKDETLDPKLPSTVAPPSGLSGLDVILSHSDGVMIQKAAVAAPDERFAKIADSMGARPPGNLEAEIKRVIEEVKATAGNPINWQRAIVYAPSDLSMSAMREVIRAFPHEYVRTMVFVGRRRIDGSYRMTGIEAALPTPDVLAEPVQYKFNEDERPTSCTRMGFMGKPPIGEVDSFFVEINPSGIRVATTKVDPETREYIIGETKKFAGTDDLTEFEAWLEANPGRQRVFISDDFTYEQASTILSRIVYKCTQRSYTLPQAVEKTGEAPERLDIACGGADLRPNTIVLGLCE